MWKEEEEKSKDLAKHFKEMALQKGVCIFVSLSASTKQIDRIKIEFPCTTVIVLSFVCMNSNPVILPSFLFWNPQKPLKGAEKCVTS